MTSTAMDLSSPLTAPLQMFNLLPSRTLHPERARALWPEDVGHDDLLTNATMQRVLPMTKTDAVTCWTLPWKLQRKSGKIIYQEYCSEIVPFF